jgi:hypothetical protein
MVAHPLVILKRQTRREVLTSWVKIKIYIRVISWVRSRINPNFHPENG